MSAAKGPTRRKFLGQVAAVCAALGSRRVRAEPVPPGSAEPALPDGRFRFLVVNDLHHGEPACTPFHEKLVEQMRRHGRVACCLLVGDLADTGLPESLAAVRDAFAGLGCPVCPVPGNHDCDVTQDPRVYSGVFPGRRNYTFTHAGWQFVALDSTDGNAWQETTIGGEAIDFLRATLPRLDPAAPTVLFTHFPIAPDIRFAPVNAAEVLSLFGDLNLRAVFCGHYHACTERPWRDAVLLTNACCSRMRDNHDGSLPEGYLVCTAHPDGRLEREFIEYVPARRVEAPGPPA